MRLLPVSLVLLYAIGLLSFAGSATAQTSNAVKFSGPVQLPGVLLPAGSYTFDVSGDGRTVIVSGVDRRLIGRFPVTPITRAEGGEIITTRVAAGAVPPEIAAVYSSGGRTGVQFLYGNMKK